MFKTLGDDGFDTRKSKGRRSRSRRRRMGNLHRKNGWVGLGKQFLIQRILHHFAMKKNVFSRGNNMTRISQIADLFALDFWHPMAWSVFSKMVIVLSFIRTLERYNESILRSPHFG